MDSAGDSDANRRPANAGKPTPVKIIVSGGFGVGKTTFVGAASEIPPLRTEGVITKNSAGIDDLSATPDKSTTTVAMDFGRISLTPELVLYLFGTPGQQRFWFMWDDLVHGAIGAVVLVDTRRLIDSFPVIDYFEHAKVPFVIAVNGFHGDFPFDEPHIREALAVPPSRPIVTCDARDNESATRTLMAVVEHALTIGGRTAPPPAAVGRTPR